MNKQVKIDLLHAIIIMFNIVMVPLGVLFLLSKYNDYEPKQ
jgi:hypothetical protein